MTKINDTAYISGDELSYLFEVVFPSLINEFKEKLDTEELNFVLYMMLYCRVTKSIDVSLDDFSKETGFNLENLNINSFKKFKKLGIIEGLKVEGN